MSSAEQEREAILAEVRRRREQHESWARQTMDALKRGHQSRASALLELARWIEARAAPQAGEHISTGAFIETQDRMLSAYRAALERLADGVEAFAEMELDALPDILREPYLAARKLLGGAK